MSEQQHWAEQNEQYLATAVAWVRLRLRYLAQQAEEATGVPEILAPAVPDPEPAQQRSFFGRRQPETPAAVPTRPVLPPPSERITERQVADAAEDLATAAATTPPPAAVALQQRFALSACELETLLLCAAVELDTRVARLCARSQDEAGRAHPTFGLGLALSSEPDWAALSPERPLRYYQLIRVHQPGAAPLTASALSIDERVLNYLKGLNYLDDRIAPLAAPFGRVEERDIPPSQAALADRIAGHLRQLGEQQRPPIVQLLGPDGEAKRLVARYVAANFSLLPMRLPGELLPAQVGELEQFIRLWQRESQLLPLALYLDAHDLDRPTGGAGAAPVNRLLARLGGLAFLDVREAWPGLGEDSLIFDVRGPTTAEQRAAWNEALGDQAGEHPARLAGHFSLAVSEIRQVARTARVAPNDGDNLGDRLWDACLLRSRPQLDILAQRIEARAGWGDLVLPASERATLRMLADQVGQRARVYEQWGFAERLSRGLGISALFAGPSGTGKTMAAEVIARELRLNLYRIDLSQVVSKYIGETEKNLRKLFDAAERGGVILFFDEADALFGKRSEVKDSHDRYANMEIDYLLQRMESYGGLAILATNMKDALDSAFTRRLRFVVNFPYPGPVERAELWRKAFPANTPTEGLDLERLGRISLSGGSIVNVALNAAFMAASAGSPVTMEHVLAAARAELRKLEIPTSEAEL